MLQELVDSAEINLTYLNLNEFLRVLQEDMPYLVGFIEKYDVSLTNIIDHCETPGIPQVHYVFNDNLGGYTIDAIKESLNEGPVIVDHSKIFGVSN